jgi:hypothetical protein
LCSDAASTVQTSESAYSADLKGLLPDKGQLGDSQLRMVKKVNL